MLKKYVVINESKTVNPSIDKKLIKTILLYSKSVEVKKIKQNNRLLFLN
jgi:hypothetical protein